MQFQACGCEPQYRHRTKRSLWMKLLPTRRLFECIECGARMLLRVKNPWPAYTGIRPKLGPAWHPDPRTLTRTPQPRPAPMEAMLPLLAAEMAARAVIAAQRAHAAHGTPMEGLRPILLPPGNDPFVHAASVNRDAPAAATPTGCLKDGKCTGLCGGNLAAGHGACLATSEQPWPWRAANEQALTLAR